MPPILHRIHNVGDPSKLSIRKFTTAAAAAISGALSVSSATSTSASANNEIYGDSAPAVYISPGFKIPPRCYSDLLSVFSDAHVVPADDRPEGDIESSARNLQQFLQRSSKKGVVLVGHSRGGAVALCAYLALSSTRRDLVKGVVLIDPVDDEAHYAQGVVESYVGDTGSCNILIVATPFAGSSAYYKTNYASVCAPEGRNADIFATALGKSRGDCSILTVALPNIGHLFLLNDVISLPVANICGPPINSRKFNAEQIRGYRAEVKSLICCWASDPSAGLSPSFRRILDNLALIDNEMVFGVSRASRLPVIF